MRLASEVPYSYPNDQNWSRFCEYCIMYECNNRIHK